MAPVVAPPPPVAPAPAAVTPPPPRRSNAPLIAAIVIGFFIVVGGLGAGAVGLALMGDGDLVSRLQGAPELPELPPPYTVQPGNEAKVDKLLADGAMHFAQGRYLDATGRYYKVVQDLEPGHPEAGRLGFVSCEYVAFQLLADDLQRKSMSDRDKEAAKKEALAEAKAAVSSGEGLVDARLKVDAALVVLPGDDKLEAAQNQVRSAIQRSLRHKPGASHQKAVRKKLKAAEKALAANDLSAARSALEAAVEADETGVVPERYRAARLLEVVEYREDHP